MNSKARLKARLTVVFALCFAVLVLAVLVRASLGQSPPSQPVTTQPVTNPPVAPPPVRDSAFASQAVTVLAITNKSLVFQPMPTQQSRRVLVERRYRTISQLHFPPAQVLALAGGYEPANAAELFKEGQYLIVETCATCGAGRAPAIVKMTPFDPRFPFSTIGLFPYRMTGHAVPGRFEAEDFDDGGQRISYLDSDAGNNGGAHRSTDVDIRRAGDRTVVFNASAGEWLSYTIDVATPGAYVIEASVASRLAGGTFHFEVDGSDVTGALQAPTTGSWHDYEPVTSPPVSLAPGRHFLRLVLDRDGEEGIVADLDSISVRRLDVGTQAEAAADR